MLEMNDSLSLKIPQTKLEVSSRLLLLAHELFHNESMLILAKKKLQGENFVDKEMLQEILKDKEVIFSQIDKGLLFAYKYYKKPDLNLPSNKLKNYSIHFRYRELNNDSALFKNEIEHELKMFSVPIPLLRAKLAIKELAFWLTNDDIFIIDLVETSLHYLQCPTIIRRIDQARIESIYSKNPKVKEKSKKFIKKINKAILGNTKSKLPLMDYWQVSYYYENLRDSISEFFLMKKRSEDLISQEIFLNWLVIHWKLSKTCRNLISDGKETAENITYGILQNKGLVKTAVQFQKGYNKNIRLLKNSNPILKINPLLTFPLLDMIAMNPQVFADLDPFMEFNHFDYSRQHKKNLVLQLRAIQSKKNTSSEN